MPIITVPNKQKITQLNEGFFDTLMNDGDNDLLSTNATKSTIDSIFSGALEVEVKPKVEKWLEEHNVINYEIVSSGNGIIVNVNDHLILPNLKLTRFPSIFKWGYVQGNCNFSNNKLTSFTEFPTRINGDLIANFNYIRSFDGLGQVNGKIYADRQKIRTFYKLNDENYKRYFNGENLMENVVYSIDDKEYGVLTHINEDNKNCAISLNNGKHVFRETSHVDVINGFQYIEQLI